MIKMCVFDVDGTLFDYYNNCVHASTIKALRKLQKKGILIAVATGRAHYGLGKALNDLHFDYICAVNGAVIADANQQVLIRHDFTREDVDQINEFAHQYDAGLAWKFIDHVYIYQHKEKIDWYEGQIHSDIGLDPFIDCPKQDRHLKDDLPQSASINASSEKIEAVFENSKRLSFLRCSDTGYDVVLKGMNKGVGLSELMQLKGLDKDEVMVFGDNYNDISMFDIAGYRIAMGNAIEEIKEKATYVTADCAHDGIYQACLHYHLI